MFNGIIFNTGKIKTIKKNKRSILIGIKSNIKFTEKDLRYHLFHVMEYV